MNRLLIVLGGLALLLLAAAPSLADPRTESNSVWSVADRCAREAARLFPDYTPQGNADRENYRRACLRANNEPAPNGNATTTSN
ncbi:MAG: hypothetical protein ACREED_01685 [Stellaceae bacterium]